jgi:hypothetical protein
MRAKASSTSAEVVTTLTASGAARVVVPENTQTRPRTTSATFTTPTPIMVSEAHRVPYLGRTHRLSGYRLVPFSPSSGPGSEVVLLLPTVEPTGYARESRAGKR